jgi:hypothetical protein
MSAMASEADITQVPERKLDEVFGAPLDEFVVVRNDVAKRLTADGKREEAAAVRALRKPTLPVWTVNQLARERKADVRALIAATERLAKVQAGGRGDFAEATGKLQAALEGLSDAAGPVVERAGRASEETVRRVTQALRSAAIADPDRLRSGTLTDEPQSAGFEALLGSVPSGGPARKAEPRRDSRAELAKARERVEALRAQIKEQRQAVRDAERREASARREWEAARAEAERLAGELERSTGELEDAEQQAKELRGRS